MSKMIDRPPMSGGAYTGEFIARDYILKSTDAMPYKGVAPGSTVTFSDTGAKFTFTDNLEWVPVGGGADPSIIGGEGAKLSDLSEVAVGWKEAGEVVLCDDDYTFVTIYPDVPAMATVSEPLDIAVGDVVTVTVGGASTQYVVFEAYNSIGFGDVDDMTFAYVYSESEVSCNFLGTMFEPSSIHHIKVTKEAEIIHKIPSDYVESSGGGQFVISIVDQIEGTLFFDKTYAEVAEAINNGNDPVIVAEGFDGQDGHFVFRYVGTYTGAHVFVLLTPVFDAGGNYIRVEFVAFIEENENEGAIIPFNISPIT